MLNYCYIGQYPSEQLKPYLTEVEKNLIIYYKAIIKL